MEYSAGMVSQLFAFVETKKTAELMVQGLERDAIRMKVEEENLYLLKNPTRLRKTFNYIYKSREIKHALVNYRIEELLNQHGMESYIRR